MVSVRSKRPHDGLISQVPQMPGLDGMRALAVVAVMLYHANNTWLHGGFLGVEVFFVISGYLITLLLIAEHERTGRVNLGAFWKRRFRRLLPALFVMLSLVMVYLAITSAKARGRTRGDIVAGLTYSSNWYQIWVGAGYTAREAFVPLRHLWSLAVEEQFYLVWPLVMVAILARGRAHLPRVALRLVAFTLAITAVVAVLYVPGDINSSCTPETMNGYWELFGRCISVNDALYLSTITRAGGLMLGAAFAMVWRPAAIMRGPLRNRGRLLDLLAIAGFVLLAALVWTVHLADPALTMLTGSRFDALLFRGGLLATGVATLMMIAAVTHARSATGVALSTPVLSWIGTRSYGLYLYHWPIYQIIRKEAGKPLTLLQFVLAMVIAIPITDASYRLVEMPIRHGALTDLFGRGGARLGRRGAAQRRQVMLVSGVAAVVVGLAGFSIVSAPNRCVGSVECASAAGNAAIAGASTTPPTATTVSPATTLAGAAPTTTPPTTIPPTTVPPTTLPVDQRPPYAIGESVMLGAAPQLFKGGFTVDAKESRQGDVLADEVATLRAAGRFGNTVVIQAGTNGPISQKTYDRIMASLPANEVKQVIFLTVRAPGKPWIDANNAVILGLPQKYPNVAFLDWNGLANSVQGLASDGVHLKTNAAQQTYANYIFDITGHRELIVDPAKV